MHDIDLIIVGRKETGKKRRRQKGKAHLAVQVIDLLDGFLDIASLYRIPYRCPLLDCFQVDGFDARLFAEVFRSRPVAFHNQIVHDKSVHCTGQSISLYVE